VNALFQEIRGEGDWLHAEERFDFINALVAQLAHYKRN
jgi:hypothetical protein